MTCVGPNNTNPKGVSWAKGAPYGPWIVWPSENHPQTSKPNNKSIFDVLKNSGSANFKFLIWGHWFSEKEKDLDGIDKVILGNINASTSCLKEPL